MAVVVLFLPVADVVDADSLFYNMFPYRLIIHVVS